MAIVVSHKNVAANRSREAVQGLYNTLNALPGVFTIIDSNNLGSEGGWFVFKMIGFDWELWVGGHQTVHGWAAGNIHNATTYSVSVALAPGGGWDQPGGDSPAGTMFSNSDASGTNWGKIRGGTAGNFFSVGNNDWYTVWYDTANGFFAVLWDHAQDNEWDEGFSVVPMTSRFPGSDPDPYILLGGTPDWGGTSEWMYEGTAGGNFTQIILPDGATYDQDAQVQVEDQRGFDANTQPNPITGDYDLEVIGIRCGTAGSRHSRGHTDPASVLECSHSLSARSTLNSMAWVVPRDNAGFVLPWDGATVL